MRQPLVDALYSLSFSLHDIADKLEKTNQLKDLELRLKINELKLKLKLKLKEMTQTDPELLAEVNKILNQ